MLFYNLETHSIKKLLYKFASLSNKMSVKTLEYKVFGGHKTSSEIDALIWNLY